MDVHNDLGDARLRVRAHDPLSSVLAAEASLQFSGAHSSRILAALDRVGSATAHELTQHTGLTVVQIDRRASELIRSKRVDVLQMNGEDVLRDGFRVLASKKFASSHNKQ